MLLRDATGRMRYDSVVRWRWIAAQFSRAEKWHLGGAGCVPLSKKGLGDMKHTPGELLAFINQVCDDDWEPGYEDYKLHLSELNRIVRESGASLEGGLFFEHLQDDVADVPSPFFRNKRVNYAVFCSSGSTLLEIGFNAGHSALLALTINPDLIYVGVDICHHPYTRPCFEYLKGLFGDRVRLHAGDSRDVLPVLRDERRIYDIIHVDGGHNFYIAHADLRNVIDLAAGGATLLFDDVNDHLISALCDYYVLRGRLSRMKLNTLWKLTNDHELFRINAA